MSASARSRRPSPRLSRARVLRGDVARPIGGFVRQNPWLSAIVATMVLDMLVVHFKIKAERDLTQLRQHVENQEADMQRFRIELAQREDLSRVASQARAQGLVLATRVAHFPPPGTVGAAPAAPLPSAGLRGAW